MPLERLERSGTQSVPFTRMKPYVTGGVCDFCGVLDANQKSEVQYQLCPHFKGLMEALIMQGEQPVLRCTYCPDNADPTEVIRRSKMKTHESPDKPGVWITLCDSYNCTLAHEKRFNKAVA